VKLTSTSLVLFAGRVTEEGLTVPQVTFTALHVSE
jgi:hypothetical protein